MADRKISELTAITGANTAADDELVIVDTSADETKKISRAELLTGIGALPLTGGTLTGVLSINASTGYANFEMGGPSGAFIDMKTPFSDDKDARIIYNGNNLSITTSLDQSVILQHNNSAKLNTTSTGVAITGTLDASAGVKVGGTDSFIYESADNQLTFRIGADGPYAKMIDAGSGVMEFGNAGGDLALTAAGTERARVTSDGLEVTGNVVSQVSINAQTGTTYTTVLADQSKLVTLTNASAITLTIPANSSVAYPVGTKIDFAQLGAGQVTFAGAGGVTVNSTPTLKLRDQYSGASCIKTATDTWLLVGDLATS